MKLKPKITIADHFSEMEDPRVERSIQHKLIDIITIAICAVICGADTWVDIETYGLAKQEWFKQFLELQNGIPREVRLEKYRQPLTQQNNPLHLPNLLMRWEICGGIIPPQTLSVACIFLRQIPSHDTFARVFARLNPEEFQQSFLSWIKSISNVTKGEVIAIDGKTLRHSYDNSQEKSAIQMVRAYF